MKMTKKKVFVIALAICLVAIISMGTLAWFNANSSMENTFLVATDENGKPDFSVDLYENVIGADNKFADTNGDNAIDDKDAVVREGGNTYKDILPGDVLDKNPTVKNTGAYEQYIRAYVTFPQAKALQDACAKYGISTDLRELLNVDATVWAMGETREDQATGGVTYCYYLKNILDVEKTATLFTNVTIPDKFVQEDFANFTEFKVGVKVDALQTRNVITNNNPEMVDAQEAFLNIGWTAFETYPDYTVNP